MNDATKLIERLKPRAEAIAKRYEWVDADWAFQHFGSIMEAQFVSMASPQNVLAFIALIEQQADRIAALTEKCVLYAASVTQADKRVGELEKDAERYRWLRDFDIRCKDGVNINPPCEHVHASMYSHAVGTIPAVRLVTGEELDRAIDAAKEKS